MNLIQRTEAPVFVGPDITVTASYRVDDEEAGRPSGAVGQTRPFSTA